MKQIRLVLVVVVAVEVVVVVLSDTSHSPCSGKHPRAAICIGMGTKIEREIRHGK